MKTTWTYAVGMVVLCFIGMGVGRAQTTDSVKAKSYSAYADVELNAGHFHGQHHPMLLDVPHITLGGRLELGRGWSANAEVEYERFYQQSVWGTPFKDNLTVNELSVTKEWASGVGLSLGVMPVPVGITNTGGPALTIYDPFSEAVLLPMTWHEGGVAFKGASGVFNYFVAAYTYIGTPLRETRALLGGAARIEAVPLSGMHMGVGAFWGTTSKGMVERSEFEFCDRKRVLYAALDVAYEDKGIVADGSVVCTNMSSGRSGGVEIGYNTLETSSLKIRLIPFGRCDLVKYADTEMHRWTAGVNIQPWQWSIVKAEYNWTYLQHTLRRGLHFSVGAHFEI